MLRRTLLLGSFSGAVGAMSLPMAARSQSGWDPELTEFDQVMGSADAPVTIIEYSSYTCPHCARFHRETLPQLKTEYIDTGIARLVFRDFPLDGVALRAGMMARCLPTPMFFTMNEVLFDQQQQWARSPDPIGALANLGRVAGLNPDAFDACMADEALADRIIQLRLEGAQRYEVSSTPTFVINGAVMAGAQPFDRFARMIEDAI